MIDEAPYAPGAARPSVDSNLKSVPKLDMDSALALLRRELAAMQLQDKALHRQLMGLQASIVGLKVELALEREQNWQMDNREVDRTPMRVPRESRAIVTEVPRQNHAIVTKVEVIDNGEESTKLQIDHTKQDSGILTDDEGNSDECDESVRKPTKNFVRLQNGRGNPFHGYRKEGGKANFLRSEDSHSSQPAKVLIRGVEVPKIRRENAEIPHQTPRQRSQTMPSGPLYRVTSMPVINEVPSQERVMNDSNKDKAFAVYAYHKRNIIEGKNSLPSFQHAIATNHKPEKLPVVFHSLQRHDSMPVLLSNVSRRGTERLRTSSDSFRLTKTPDSQRITRRVSASCVDPRRSSSPVKEKTTANSFKRHEPTKTQSLTKRVSTSYIDLRRTSLSPSEEKAVKNVDYNEPGETQSLTRRVSTSSIDIRARSSLGEGGKSVGDINCNKADNHSLMRRISTSYVDLRSPSTPSEESRTPIKDINFNEPQPMHKLYRSHSHTSLV